MDNRERFVMILTGVSEIYGKEISTAAINVWWQALSRYPIEDAVRAFGVHVNDAESGRFMPRPADIAKVIDGSPSEKSLIAWQKVEQAVRSHGGWSILVFDDAAIHQAIQTIGGWQRFCTCADKEWPFLRQEFERHYSAAIKRPSTAYPPQITGEPTAAGEPVLIGDPDKAQAVLAGGTDGALAYDAARLPSNDLERLTDESAKFISAPELENGS
jgi:hypothetical protein